MQPIGRLLFRKFCSTNDAYHNCNQFLDSLEKYDIQPAEKKASVCNEIVKKFLNNISSQNLLQIIPEERVKICLENCSKITKDLFADCLQ